MNVEYDQPSRRQYLRALTPLRAAADTRMNHTTEPKCLRIPHHHLSPTPRQIAGSVRAGLDARCRTDTLSYLLGRPSMVTRYARESLFNRATPLNLELPWIAHEAIDFLDQYLKPSHDVAEFGGGGSTVYFARRVRSVLCVESSEEWREHISRHAQSLGIGNVRLLLHSYDPQDQHAFESSDYARSLDGLSLDVVLVDGYETNVSLRPFCFWAAENVIRPGGIIIVDDAWRYPELRSRNRAKSWREFRSTGPCRPGVTTTDVYFY